MVSLLSGLQGCAKDETAPPSNYCAPENLSASASAGSLRSNGASRVFLPDPIVSSANPALSPSVATLDGFAREVELKNLEGLGVLKGKYVDVRDGNVCGRGYGAYDTLNNFSYAHSDPRFQEAMAYYWGDRYREHLDDVGYLQDSGPVQIYAHCPEAENAYFYKTVDASGAPVQRVCLGYSAETVGAFYADDATVTVHELQHATTTNTYAPNPRGHLNQLWYDEAGGLNEAVSDFMALVFEQPYLAQLDHAIFDPRLFSRWALGTFIPNQPSTRGANRCPTYDSAFPNCGNFPAFSATNNTISYVYPDGMGWPYANNFDGPGFASSAFSSYKWQEEIHNTGVLLEGALWDAYEGIRANHGGNSEVAQSISSKIVLEAIKHLPQPSLTASTPVLSPVTYRALAAAMVQYAPLVGLDAQDQASVVTALTDRGLYAGTQLTSSWLNAGPGNSSVTPGLRILDNPTKLRTWMLGMFGDPIAVELVPQGIQTGLNSKLDAGELVALWFDLQNVEATSAGGVQVTITALDPEVVIDEQTNIGWISDTQAQMIYGKVNGTSIVSALSSPNATYHVATGNSYFKSNPFFDRSWTTAIFVKVRSNAASGATVRFRVDATPSNGATSTTTFIATIN